MNVEVCKGSNEPKKAKQVEVQMDGVFGCLGVLEECIGRLDAALVSVLRKKPADDIKKVDEGEDIVLLASKLKSVRYNINSRIDEINHIIDRLEI